MPLIFREPVSFDRKMPPGNPPTRLSQPAFGLRHRAAIGKLHRVFLGWAILRGAGNDDKRTAFAETRRIVNNNHRPIFCVVIIQQRTILQPINIPLSDRQGLARMRNSRHRLPRYCGLEAVLSRHFHAIFFRQRQPPSAGRGELFVDFGQSRHALFRWSCDACFWLADDAGRRAHRD